MKEEKNHTYPTVSVIMPAYNAERFIEAAVRSVASQSFQDWELIIIDDRSKDGTADIAMQLAQEDGRIRFFQNEENLGVARTRNRGFDLCRGSFVALLDSDDIWHPEKLERQLQLAGDTGADIVYCSYGIIGADGGQAKPAYLVPERTDFERLLRENTIGCSTVLLTAPIVEKYRFATDFYHEDYVLWLQLLREGHRAAGCTEVLVDWRYLENSRSFNKQKSARNRWRIYRDYLKLPLGKSAWAFCGYVCASLRKYGRRS